MKEVLAKVFGDLKPCQMEYYSEAIGEVFRVNHKISVSLRTSMFSLSSLMKMKAKATAFQ